MGFLLFFWKPYLNPNISGWKNGMFHCGEGWLINLFSNHHFSGHINEVHTQSLGYKGEGAWSPQVALYHLVGLKKINTRVRDCPEKKQIDSYFLKSVLLAEMIFRLSNKKHRNLDHYLNRDEGWGMASLRYKQPDVLQLRSISIVWILELKGSQSSLRKRAVLYPKVMCKRHGNICTGIRYNL